MGLFKILFVCLVYTFSTIDLCIASLPPPCESTIYCQGELLHTVQLSNIFDDSKTFVDKKLLHPPNVTLENFKIFMDSTNHNPTKPQIQEFVSKNFGEESELENWNPPDFKPDPNFLQYIDNATIKNYAEQLVKLWPQLARKMKDDVSHNSDRYSFIPVSNGFIVPGGRFREYYYWDSYWVIKGLLISEMHKTARGMIDNFISLVNRFGFIPNGGRVYYLNRSQPPLLTAMAYAYYKHTNDTNWLKDSLKYLDKELQFWLKNRTAKIETAKYNITLAHYRAESKDPRPESYYEDYLTVSNTQDLDKRQQMYIDLKSGAEAGWDFSSRWFFDEAGNNLGNLSTINTRRVIPADLNAMLCGAFNDISEMYQEVGESDKSEYWAKKNLEWLEAIELVLWDEEDGIWYDYDSKLLKPRKQFYPSNVAPLWTNCYKKQNGPKLGKRVAKYLEGKGLLNYFGGIPTSLEQTGEQWDYPNAWPPLQDMIVQGLKRSGSPEAEIMAKTFAKRWIDSNVIGFIQNGDMFEKYDAVNPGRRGGGGEYNVQKGFGWSNGVALQFIYDYYMNNTAT